MHCRVDGSLGTQSAPLAAVAACAPTGQRGEVSGVGRFDHLALDNREDDFDLVEPAGADGQVAELGVRPGGARTIDRSLPAVRRPGVDHPVDPPHTVQGSRLRTRSPAP